MPDETRDSLEPSRGDSTDLPDLSVIVPVFNEAENLEPFCQELYAVLTSCGIDFELIVADDGSTDATPGVLARLSERCRWLRVITLRRNSGQTAALSAGIDRARGRVLVPMDGDLQNDPADIARLLEKLREGYDVVSGWRQHRKDPWLSRRLPSRVANRLIAWMSGLPLHDFGCTLKAYRHDALKGLRLYGEMHRFVPIYAAWQGARVTEIPVNHRSRTRGRSKYGIGRTFRVVLDLMLLLFLERYQQRPMHLFGGFGLLSLFIAFIGFTAATFFKIVNLIGAARYGPPRTHWPWFLPPRAHWPWFFQNFGKDFVETPLPVLVAIFGVTGILSILMGLLAEMVMRTYFESQDKRTYMVKEPGERADRGIEDRSRLNR